MADIRPAKPADLAAIERCAREAYEIYVKRIGKDPAPMVADFAARIESKTLHVLEHEGAVAGFVVFYPCGDHVHLENVAVAGDAQGRGFGSKLIAFAEDETRRTGFSRVELHTNEKMTENIPYYANRGYTEIGRWEEDGFNRIFFRKVL